MIDITLRQAQLFLALVRSGRIQSVAKEFHLTQSAVSTAIKRFEESVGASLFDRAHKKISPNSNGKVLAEELSPLVQRFEDVALMFKKDCVTGDLEIGASQTLADYVLPQVLYDFQLQHPKAHLSIWTGNSKSVVRAVELGEVPVGYIEGEVHSRILTSTLIGTEELVVVTADKKFAGARSYTMEELLGHRWIMRESGSGTRETFFHQLKERGQQLNVFMELDHMESIKHVLRNKGTLACLSQHCVMHELARGTLYPVQIDKYRFTRNIYQVIHPRQSVTILMEAVFEEVNAAMQSISKSMSTLRGAE
ncbi:LysR family transcriptional regulator [Desulfopila aestuarii]|uniref:DNA-binding transcriptional regulator, LysR family n=1 Tax=Desulfopila aestuarii DSM 18488 TaxID=1121416 RepID=A0A1M7YFD2_9BACT|nr:LysR family transcriptional regulator [Desulfopila aestuarii]SHO51291.1 DNA-binding transcriptional regulator, LysR family [Desulfopila aestuarii DSM 18488]